MEEMIEIPRLSDNLGLNIPWLHGGPFRKRLTSSPLHSEPSGKQGNIRPNLDNYFTRLVQGLEPLESCVTDLSELKSAGNIDTFNAVHSMSDTAEDGISDTTQENQQNVISLAVPAPDTGKGKKRKRLKVSKNSEEVQSQRMTHIEVERNRRKQMNAHLDALRSLIPQSYIQRGDQASIIGGAIDLVKELEQVLQSLQFQKIKMENVDRTDHPKNCLSILPLHQSSARCNSKCVLDTSSSQLRAAEGKSSIADIEVSLIETHCSLKILSKKKHGQLLKIVTALEGFHMTILHLNITSTDEAVLFSFNVKVEDECPLTSANDIANSLQQILRIVHAC